MEYDRNCWHKYSLSKPCFKWYIINDTSYINNLNTSLNQTRLLASTDGSERVLVAKVKDSFKKIDFGANVGLGYKLENGLNFGVRYNLGLSNINNVSGSSDKYKNGVLQASVGYFFF